MCSYKYWAQLRGAPSIRCPWLLWKAGIYAEEILYGRHFIGILWGCSPLILKMETWVSGSWHLHQYYWLPGACLVPRSVVRNVGCQTSRPQCYIFSGCCDYSTSIWGYDGDIPWGGWASNCAGAAAMLDTLVNVVNRWFRSLILYLNRNFPEVLDICRRVAIWWGNFEQKH